jgi:dihydrofolate reductase
MAILLYMRKLIVQQWATVDNIVAEEDGGLSFVDVPPYDELPDEDLKTSVMEFIDSVDTMILGANTYNIFVPYWPSAKEEGEGEFADKLNHLNKYVASKTLTSAPWGDHPAATVTADPVATIKELKQQDGKDIVLWGSLTLMQAMFDAGVVDEVQLRVCPTTRGKGTHMFNDRQDLKLIEAKPFKNGTVLLRYAMNKNRDEK